MPTTLHAKAFFLAFLAAFCLIEFLDCLTGCSSFLLAWPTTSLKHLSAANLLLHCLGDRHVCINVVDHCLDEIFDLPVDGRHVSRCCLNHPVGGWRRRRVVDNIRQLVVGLFVVIIIFADHHFSNALVIGRTLIERFIAQ